MVTLYDLGISISFIINGVEIDLINVAETKEEIGSVNLSKIQFREYENISLKFNSISEMDRLYFDGIDLLPADICECDENGNLYLKPQKEDENYSVFEYSSEYYAMRVGTFEICILHNNQTYFQWFTVLPKNVNSNEWSIMQKELEEEIQGLSSDFIRKNMSLGSSINEVIPSKELYKFFVIKKYFNSILASLVDLKEKPNYKVEKEYKLESLCRATYIDNITVKDYLTKGIGQEQYLVPKRIYNYDLPENRWLKKIIELYEDEVKLFRQSTIKYIEYIRIEIKNLNKYPDANIGIIHAKEKIVLELNEYLEMAKNVLYISQLIKTKEWYKQIKKVNSLLIPHVLIYDVRYNVFYKLYKELQQDNITIQWNENYSYSWKLSSKMYEIWCFIKICRFLISDEIRFEAKGWIFDECKKERILIPELIPGTKVEFVKENFVLKLYYEKNITQNPNDTNNDTEPIFLEKRQARNHTKPDIRMDLYKNNIYWSSLIFEVKYRTIKNFWTSKEFSAKEQIKTYKDDMKSRFTRGLEPTFVVRRLRPVDRVWVLNPTHSCENIIDRQNEGIKFIQLIPGEDYINIIKELKEEINGVFDGELN